jgi:hypothetical protein
MKALILIGVTYAAILWIMYAAFRRWKRRTNTCVKPDELRVGQKFYYYEDHSLRSARIVKNLPESSAVYARRVSDWRMVRIDYKQISRLV